MKVIPFSICLQLLCDDFELLLNKISLSLEATINVLQSLHLQSCHFLTNLVYQDLNDYHSWHRIVFVESSMLGWYYNM